VRGAGHDADQESEQACRARWHRGPRHSVRWEAAREAWETTFSTTVLLGVEEDLANPTADCDRHDADAVAELRDIEE
jgi:hypothetical protein